ncbi:hypothetical protein QOT17_006154 [Balamuthia mandrillaris]
MQRQAALFLSVVALFFVLQVLYSFSPSSPSSSAQLRIKASATTQQTTSFVASSSPPPSNQCLIFWHVKKTGGTTLRHILLKDSELRDRTFSWERGFTGGFDSDVVFGHAPVSRVIHLLETNDKNFTGQNITLLADREEEAETANATGAECYWMMSLRNPLERFLSRFYFKKRWGDSVEDFVLNGSKFALRSFQLLRDEQEFLRLKAVLHRFDLIVLSERFDESLLLLMEDRMIGEEAFLDYTNFGILHGRPKASDFSPIVRQRLEELLHLDILLYQQAEQLWQKKARSSRFGGEEGLRKRLEELQREKGVHRGCAEEGETKLGGSGHCKEFSQTLGATQQQQ